MNFKYETKMAGFKAMYWEGFNSKIYLDWN
jgi:hypothetical protein